MGQVEKPVMDIMDQCIRTFLGLTVTPSGASVIDRSRAFKRAKKSGKLEHIEDYKKKQSKVTNMLKSTKFNFMNLDPSNPKAFWKATKLPHCNKTTNHNPILQDDGGNIIWDDAEKIKLFNENVSTECYHCHG